MPDAPTPDSDADLLPRLLAGERVAFESLVRSYHQPMKRVAMAIVGEAQAEEAVQEAWLVAVRSLATFEGRSSLRTWLFSIVANEAKSRLRKERTSRGRREVSLDALPDSGGLFDSDRWLSDGHWSEPPGQWHDASPEALLSHEEFRKCLDKTLAKLPDDQKAVLTLREIRGLELADICNILDISASNVRVLVHRARLQVYAMVEHFEETGTC
ncbi:MAG: sigma-70 family RNA polymerase sigma factor [Halioglobus sp.]